MNNIKNILKICLGSLMIFPFLLGGVTFAVNDLLRQLMDPAIESDTIIDMGENVNTVGENVFEGSIDITILDIESVKRIIKTDSEGKPLCKNKKEEVPCSEECSYIGEDNKKKCNKKRAKWPMVGGSVVKTNSEGQLLCYGSDGQSEAVCTGECSSIKGSRKECKDKRVRIYTVGGGITTSPSIIVKVTRLLLLLTITLSITMILWNGMSYIIQTGQGKEGKNLVKNIVYIVIGILIALFSVIIITVIQSVPATIEKEINVEYDNTTDNDAVDDREALIRKGKKKQRELVRGSFSN